MIGCQKNISEEIDINMEDQSLISGEAVAEILRACKYLNGNFCSEKCCISEQFCDVEQAYMECDLKTGEWKDIVYEDSKCLLKCEQLENVDSQIEPIKKSTPCNESWKCVDIKYRAYQMSDCSWSTMERCDYKCEDGVCKPAPFCIPNNLKCDDGDLKKCNENGTEWLINESCINDCYDDKCVHVNETAESVEGGNGSDDTGANETTQMDYIADECIEIINFNYDAAGSDSSSNLNDEYFTLKNSCSYPIDMTSWTAKDAAEHKFTFPSFNLGINAEVTVHTGSGADDSANLYWGRGSHVWNNGGDTLYLDNSDGTSVLIYSYP